MLGHIIRPLTEWYKCNKRDLPWRTSPTPYRVWVSEIMLQQTRVEAVRTYYLRFMQRLPNIRALAEAEDDLLLKLWEGLGYYSRVRNLKKAARLIMDQYGGLLPASYEALRTLPGIGAYTAGAIASIAFGIPVPAVDGNVLRVLSRMLGSYADVTAPRVKEAYRMALLDIVPGTRPGDFNQALMELGATVCLPNPKAAPDCPACPVRGECSAYSMDCAISLPVKTPKKDRSVEKRTIVLVTVAGKVLLFRRKRGLLAGMYEPLNLEGHLEVDQLRQILKAYGCEAGEIIPLPSEKHIFTHIEWQMHGYCVKSIAFPLPDDAVFADLAQLADAYAVPSAFKAYMRYIV